MLRFCLKVNSFRKSNMYYIKAKTESKALAKFAKDHPLLKITKIEFVGDALPAPKATIAQIVKEEKQKRIKKARRWLGLKKYQSKTGLAVFTPR